MKHKEHKKESKEHHLGNEDKHKDNQEVKRNVRKTPLETNLRELRANGRK